MYKKRTKQKIKYFFSLLIVGLVFSQAGGWTSVHATADPTDDYTQAPFSWIRMLGNDGTTFTSRSGSHDEELFYGPIRIDSDITNVNSVKMYFRATGQAGTPLVCPDSDLTNSYSEKFAGVEFARIGDATDSYATTLSNLGISTSSTYTWGSSPTKYYQDTSTHGIGTAHSNPPTGNWTKMPDGSCEIYLTSTGDNSSLITQFDSGWYMLRFPLTSVDSHSSGSFTSELAFNDADTSQISVLGDESYDTTVTGSFVSGGGTPVSFISNAYSPDYAPFAPTFPYISFDFRAPPTIVKDTFSCNPFSSNILTAFFNPDFSFTSCSKSVLNWAFVPTTGSLHQFSTLSLSTREPFSYLYDMGNVWDDLFSDSGSMEYAVSVPFLGHTLDLISASQISAVPYASTIKDILTGLIYFFTILTLYRMLLKSHSNNH